MIRPLTTADISRTLEVINWAAQAYRGVIPDDCWQEPYMSREELLEEVAAGVEFWGYEAQTNLVAVMGRQDLAEVTLVRHAYVHPEYQRQGVGGLLMAYLCRGVTQPILVGTWAAAWWALRFYQKRGFRQVSPAEKDRLLTTYWTISPRQVETSVVLADQAWFASPLCRETT